MTGYPALALLQGAARGLPRWLGALDRERFVPRLWEGDPSLWIDPAADPAGAGVIRSALGWLRIAGPMTEAAPDLARFAAEVRAAGIRHVVHMGMGGSSLAPIVFASTRAAADGLPVDVLDTTDPATILALERRLPLDRTLFIVASKSGTTTEPLAFGEYFYAKVRAIRGEAAGAQFVAVTDPGTPLARQGADRKYRRVFLNAADIGGRYSALSYFGLVPAALMGADVAGLLARASAMGDACGPAVPAPENPGVALGALMGHLARQGRGKVTFIVPAPLATFGAWLEQLLAESTGKNGTGLLPVAGEPVGAPALYGADRLFVHIRLGGAPDSDADRRAAALRRAGQPVATLDLDDLRSLGAEFLRWEIATATAGAILRINAFDQPNVQESKDNTTRLLDVVRRDGRLPEPPPAVQDGSLALDAETAAEDAAGTLSRFFATRRPGDYIALLAYLTETPETTGALQTVRVRLRDATRLATTLGYGPRYLHSTGQYHKGGPNTGLFLLITADDPEDAPIPDVPYTFGVLKRAQALGDLEALRRHGRRAVRVHLRGQVGDGLRRLAEAALRALGEGAP